VGAGAHIAGRRAMDGTFAAFDNTALYAASSPCGVHPLATVDSKETCPSRPGDASSGRADQPAPWTIIITTTIIIIPLIIRTPPIRPSSPLPGTDDGGPTLLHAVRMEQEFLQLGLGDVPFYTGLAAYSTSDDSGGGNQNDTGGGGQDTSGGGEATHTRLAVIEGRQGRALVLDPAGGDALFFMALPDAIRRPTALTTYMPVSGGAARVVVGFSNGGIGVWDGEGGHLAFTLTAPDGDTRHLLVFHDPLAGQPRLAAGGESGTVHVWALGDEDLLNQVS
jgi:hypothetical protein